MIKLKKGLLFLTIAMLVFACPEQGVKVVTGIEVTPTSVEIIEGQSSTLTATILPEDAENKNVVWSTSDAAVAQINNGVITAVKEGKTTITVASEENGTIKATCEVTVVIDTSIKKIELKGIPEDIVYESEFPLTDDQITYSPIGTSDTGFTVEFKTAGVLEYNKDTKKVTTKAPGITKMIVKSKIKPEVSASIDIKVALPSGENLKREDSTIIVPALYDEVNKTAVSNKNVDLFSGADAFKLYYQDNFDYPSTEAFWAKKTPANVPAWKEKTTFNLSPKCVRIENNELVLSVVRRRTPAKFTGSNNVYYDITQEDITRANTRAGALVGGIQFGERMEYGYLEADLKVMAKSYSAFWCGFYTYGVKRDSDDKWIGGYEFDVYEQPKNNYVDVVSHWPYANANGRFATCYVTPTATTGVYVKAAVSWSPSRVVYYINDKMVFYHTPTKVIKADGSDVGFSRGSLQAIKDANNHANASPQSAYQVIANIPQDIMLVIAANAATGNDTYSGGATSVWNAPDNYTFDFIYYRNFKLYKYVGKVE